MFAVSPTIFAVVSAAQPGSSSSCGATISTRWAISRSSALIRTDRHGCRRRVRLQAA
jgi:hypothetical protein